MESKAQNLSKTVVPKLWGFEEWLVNNELYCGKVLHIRPGYRCSLHYHKIKDETFVALEGTTKLEWRTPDGQTRLETLRGDERNAVRLPPGTPHRFWAMEGERSMVLEFSTRHDDEDVVRLEESEEYEEKPKYKDIGFKGRVEAIGTLLPGHPEDDEDIDEDDD